MTSSVDDPARIEDFLAAKYATAAELHAMLNSQSNESPLKPSPTSSIMDDNQFSVVAPPAEDNELSSEQDAEWVATHPDAPTNNPEETSSLKSFSIPLSASRWARVENGSDPIIRGLDSESAPSSHASAATPIGDAPATIFPINADDAVPENGPEQAVDGNPPPGPPTGAGRPRPRPKPLDLSVPRPVADPFMSPDSQPLYTSPSHPLEDADDEYDQVPYLGSVEQEQPNDRSADRSGSFATSSISLRGNAEAFTMYQPTDGPVGIAHHGDSTYESTFNRSNILNNSSPTRMGKLWSPATAASQLSTTAIGRVGRRDAYARSIRGVDTQSVAGVIQSLSDDGDADEITEKTHTLAHRLRRNSVRAPGKDAVTNRGRSRTGHSVVEMVQHSASQGHVNRTVVLYHLPIGSRYTFVQSLIHGGGIETMSINESGTSAHVTFTTAQACKAFWEQYPIGMNLNYRGKKLRIGVAPCMEDQHLDSKLEGYLAAGATRIVHVTGIDEGLSMRLVYKMAAGLNGVRKIEAIQDFFSDDLRTSTIRFVSIADAVAFKGQWKKDSVWDSINFQFGADPCEAATGCHFK